MDFKEFNKNFKPYITNNSLNSDLYNTVKAFTSSSSYRVCDDEKADAMAYINMVNKSIVFNPLLISAAIFDLRKELGLVTKYDNFVLDVYKKLGPLGTYIKTFLLLHEIGHWLYTCDPRDVIPLTKQYCSNIPTELCMYLYNVVEDSVIERLFMLDYRGKFYRECFNLGICCFQGGEAVKTYVANSEEQSWSIKTKLFYFIIRAYNLHNSEVQNMFNIPDKIGWQADTLAAFDQAITTIDTLDRAKYCFEVLAPLVFRDLLEEIDDSNLTSTSSNAGLLDQDKLYKAKDNSSDNSSSNKESSDDIEDTDAEDGDDSNSGESNENSDSSSSDEESEDSSSTSESSSSNNEASDSDTSEDSDANDSKDTSESASSSGSSSENESPSEVIPEDTRENITKQIIEACKELNKSINGSDEPSNTVSPVKTKPQNPTALACGIRDHTIDSYDTSCTATMNRLTLEIYGNALNVLDKIFTMNDEVLRGLDQGELDEDELYTYYTEKNLNIYMEEHKVKKDKKVVCYFVLDNSCSMDGKRFDYSSAAFIGLIHALEDIQIKCCMFSFGRCTRLIKRFDEPLNLLGAESLLAGRVENFVSNTEGDTILHPALDYILADATFQDPDPDLCKVVIVATDGCTRYESLSAALAEQISKEALMFAVGLDMKGQESYLQRVMPGSIVKNYSGNDIATQLPEDIYEAIIEKFLLY